MTDNEVITAGEIAVTEIRAADIEADHISIGTWNGKTGAESRFGVRHLYSDKYRERWPQDRYPEKYEEDTVC